MDRAELIARVSAVQASDRAKEIFVRVKLFGHTQTSIARDLGITISSVSLTLQRIEQKIDRISLTNGEKNDWRHDRLKLECDLADALQREKFLQDKLDRLMRREFWRSELRVPKIQKIWRD